MQFPWVDYHAHAKGSNNGKRVDLQADAKQDHQGVAEHRDDAQGHDDAQGDPHPIGT